MTQAAIILAIYVVLVVIWPFSSGAIQVRLSEALTILPVTTAAIEGVTLGCLIANIVTGCALPGYNLWHSGNLHWCPYCLYAA